MHPSRPRARPACIRRPAVERLRLRVGAEPPSECTGSDWAQQTGGGSVDRKSWRATCPRVRGKVCTEACVSRTCVGDAAHRRRGHPPVSAARSVPHCAHAIRTLRIGVVRGQDAAAAANVVTLAHHPRLLSKPDHPTPVTRLCAASAAVVAVRNPTVDSMRSARVPRIPARAQMDGCIDSADQMDCLRRAGDGCVQRRSLGRNGGGRSGLAICFTYAAYRRRRDPRVLRRHVPRRTHGVRRRRLPVHCREHRECPTRLRATPRQPPCVREPHHPTPPIRSRRLVMCAAVPAV
eukprot:6181484-Pleurochrysis_carterae.AAC.5